MIVLIIGGAKSSKSSYAEFYSSNLSKKGKEELYYLATMNPYEYEDFKQIENQLKNREK